MAQLRRQLSLDKEQMSAYQGLVRKVLQDYIEYTGLAQEGLFWGLTLEAGIKQKKAWIEWLEEAIVKIESLDIPGTED